MRHRSYTSSDVASSYVCVIGSDLGSSCSSAYDGQAVAIFVLICWRESDKQSGGGGMRIAPVGLA